MIEALTSDEIVAASKKWQTKISSGEGVSIGELFDLTADVIRIRFTAGLAKRRLGSYDTMITGKGKRPYLVGDLGESEKEWLEIFVFGKTENPKQIKERFHLEKITELETVVEIDENSDLVTKLQPTNTRISMRAGVEFPSHLVGYQREIWGETRYEDQGKRVLSDSASRLATAIWESHIADRAPFKRRYLISKLP